MPRGKYERTPEARAKQLDNLKWARASKKVKATILKSEEDLTVAEQLSIIEDDLRDKQLEEQEAQIQATQQT